MKKRPAKRSSGSAVLEGVDASLLDIVDHVLTKGIVVTGDLVLGVADVDLVYLRVSAVLCAADRVLGPRAKPRPARRRPSIARKLGS
ncbi:MAG: gas vesicle protein [Labilithrix sp.]|nr:gas vesicle protein [Labilithrix sp.]